jgi:hypothetical protein
VAKHAEWSHGLVLSRCIRAETDDRRIVAEVESLGVVRDNGSCP